MNGIIIFQSKQNGKTAEAGKTVSVNITSMGDHFIIITNEVINQEETFKYKNIDLVIKKITVSDKKKF